MDADAVTVRDAMSRRLATCSVEDDLFTIIQSMRIHGVRRMPVLDGKGSLAGIVSSDDIVGALAQHLVDLCAAMRRQQVQEMQHRQ